MEGEGTDPAIGQVRLEDHGDGVCANVLNRAEKRNAFNSTMVNRLYALLADAVEDDSVKVIVLRANGDHFCAGGDLDEMLSRGARDGLGAGAGGSSRASSVWRGRWRCSGRARRSAPNRPNASALSAMSWTMPS